MKAAIALLADYQVQNYVRRMVFELDKIYFTEWEGNGILGINIKETDVLRGLHNRINYELSKLFVDTSAAHDGAGYHFRMMIELGKVDNQNRYRNYFERLESRAVDLVYQAKQIALFYSPDHQRSFICYKVLPLTGAM